jgi:menaquinone-9 beta-reductase
VGDTGVWDLVVVGAGPAGSAAALSALRRDPGARVLLLDRAAFPRDKCCGDGVAPHALDELARLGAAHVLADRVPVTALRLRTASGTEAARSMRRPDAVVPREVLDARLVEAAVARGAVLQQRKVRTVEQRGDLVLVDGYVAARVVVGADGANGVVRRALGLGPAPDASVAVAVRGYVPSPTRSPEQLVVTDDEAWPAYAWRFDTGDGTSNVGYGMLLPSLRERGRAGAGGRRLLLERLVALLPEADGATRLVSHHLPLSTSRPRQPDGRVLLAGDAASLVNPLTGEGVFYALLSGRLAGVAAGLGATAGTAYRQGLRAELGRHLRHTTVMSRLTARPGVVEAGVAAARDDAVAFDALVELGLGRGLVGRRLATAAAGALVRRAGRAGPRPPWR